jgi:nitroimidazol reductase NimA-like FMN-containing flavoprotein (pyridoxamine 5'-phosphate oxidase superfamily)
MSPVDENDPLPQSIQSTPIPRSTQSTTITRLPEKARFERADLDQLLDTVVIGHVGLVVDDLPVVVPTAVVRDGDQLLLHGSTGSRWMRLIADGTPIAVAVTGFDGLVVARSAFESSIHYRSAVLFGQCAVVGSESKRRCLDLLTTALLPGRLAEIREPTVKELAATLVLALPIERWSLKVSAGWPDDPPSDVAGAAWAGVIPAQISYGNPLPAPDLRAGIEPPPSVRRFESGTSPG